MVSLGLGEARARWSNLHAIEEGRGLLMPILRVAGDCPGQSFRLRRCEVCLVGEV